MVAELWLYPSGDRIFELSTKCLPSEAFQVAAETRVYLSENGIDLSGEQRPRHAPRSSSSRASSRRAEHALDFIPAV